MRKLTVLLVAGLFSLHTKAAAKSPFTGLWEGTVNDLPGVEITIREDAGQLSGTVGFYFQTRANESEKWHVEGKSAGPLLALKVEGHILTFETTHHKTHGSTELGPNVKFRVELTGANEARLSRLGSNPDPSPGLKLTRRERDATK